MGYVEDSLTSREAPSPWLAEPGLVACAISGVAAIGSAWTARAARRNARTVASTSAWCSYPTHRDPGTGRASGIVNGSSG